MKQLKRKLIVFLGILFVMCSDYDEYTKEPSIIQKSKYVLQEKKNDDLVNDKKIAPIINKISKLNQKNKNNRVIYSDNNDFFIDSEKAIYIENKETTSYSYTFKVNREQHNGLLENIVFSFPEEGIYQIALVQYQLTPQEEIDLQDNISIDLTDNPRTITNIDDENFEIENLNKIMIVQGAYCVSLVEVSCGCNEHDDLTGYGNCNCKNEIVLWRDCDYGSGWDGTFFGDGETGGMEGDIPNDGGYGNPSNTNTNDPISNNCKGCGEIATTPVLENELENEDKDPCNQLKNTQNDSITNLSNPSNVKAMLTDLKSKVQPSGNFYNSGGEAGYTVYPNNDANFSGEYYELTPEQMGSANFNGYSNLVIVTIMHTHGTMHYSVPSLDDIHTMYTLTQSSNINKTDNFTFYILQLMARFMHYESKIKHNS